MRPLTSKGSLGATPTALYLLPGLGADRRMFAGQRPAFPHLRSLAWRQPEPGESLHDYAARLAHHIPEGPFVVGGASFGGVVAQEIAALRRPHAIVLIATLTSPHEITHPLRWAKALPPIGFQVAANILTTMASASSLSPPRPRNVPMLLARMLAEANPSFVAWAMREVLQWRPPSPTGVPTLRLHGRLDRIVQPGASESVVWIRGAGHMVNMTHARLVNREVCRFLGQLG